MLGVAMEREIGQQPGIFRSQVAAYGEAARAALEGQRFDMILLAARGSSDCAALYGRYLAEIHLQIPVSLAAPSVLTRYGARLRYPRCLAIGISQSGAAPDVAEVLAYAREAGHATLAVTNTLDSVLSQTAEHTVHLACGPEEAVAATKTYSASLLALVQVVRALGGHVPDPAGHLPDDAWLDVVRQAAAACSGTIVRASTTFALARGYDYATALETALKLMECALLPCKSYSTADFMHGPKALAGHGTAALVFGEEPLDALQAQGCELVRAPSPPASTPAELTPLWNACFAQWLALLVARSRGLDPDAPMHLSKITRTR